MKRFSLSEFYFRPRTIELDGRVYEWLGVVPFKRVLARAVKPNPSRPTANAYVIGGRSRADVVAFERRTRRSETIHLLGLGISAIFLVLAALGKPVMYAAGLVVFAANFHCFILQRYNRIRIRRVLDRRSGDKR